MTNNLTKKQGESLNRHFTKKKKKKTKQMGIKSMKR